MITAQQPAHLPRVFSHANVARLALQNRLVRRLRDLGVQVQDTQMDQTLSIHLRPQDALKVTPLASCISRSHRPGDAHYTYCVHVDQCLIYWEVPRDVQV